MRDSLTADKFPLALPLPNLIRAPTTRKQSALRRKPHRLAQHTPRDHPVTLPCPERPPNDNGTSFPPHALPRPTETNCRPTNPRTHVSQTALFNFPSLLLVILLLICTSTYVHAAFPGPLDRHRHGPLGLFWKCARIGERLSPWVSIACVVMAVSPVVSFFPLQRSRG